MPVEWRIRHPQLPAELTDDERRARTIYAMHMTSQAADIDWVKQGIRLEKREVGEWETVSASISGRLLDQIEKQDPPKGGRRGRKFMSPEERLEVSVRMRKYWADRRACA